MTVIPTDWVSCSPARTQKIPESETQRELTLAAIPSAVSCARILVHHTFLDANIDDEIVTRLEHVTAEMVYHAVKTIGVSDALPLYHQAFDHLALIVVRLRLTTRHALVEVWDQCNETPLPELSQSHAIAMADDWGCTQASPKRRVVWCVVATLSPMERKTGADLLPKRVPRPQSPNAQRGSGNIPYDLEVAQLALSDGRRLASVADQEETASMLAVRPDDATRNTTGGAGGGGAPGESPRTPTP